MSDIGKLTDTALKRKEKLNALRLKQNPPDLEHAGKKRSLETESQLPR